MAVIGGGNSGIEAAIDLAGICSKVTVFEFLEEEEEIEVEKDAVPVDTLAGNVTFEHVNFGYNTDQTIINDFSVDVKEGQKVALVGPTEAGKTT